jgi:hypothetical protein
MFWLIVLALLAFAAYMYSQSDPALAGAAATPPCVLPTIPDKGAEEDEEEQNDAASPRALIGQTVESLDWLNEITKATWPHVCAIVNKGAFLSPRSVCCGGHPVVGLAGAVVAGSWLLTLIIFAPLSSLSLSCSLSVLLALCLARSLSCSLSLLLALARAQSLARRRSR